MKHHRSWKYYNQPKKSNILKELLVMCILSVILYTYYTHAYYVKKEPILEEKKQNVQIVNILSTSSTVSIVKTVHEPTMKEWVKAETTKAGMKWEEVDCVIWGESRWWDLAINFKSKDIGLWQFNEKAHPDITRADMLDYKKATYHAISVWKSWGKSYAAWYAYRDNKCWRFK